VSNIHADVICENDAFKYDCGEVKKHLIDFRKERGAMFACYCVITFKDGTRKAEVMSKADVDKIRARSKAGQSGPWVTDYNEMAKKTVFKRASKWVQLSSEVIEAIQQDDAQYETHVFEAPKKRIQAGALLGGTKTSEEPTEATEAQIDATTANDEALPL
jgi:recombination protein RecT